MTAFNLVVSSVLFPDEKGRRRQARNKRKGKLRKALAKATGKRQRRAARKRYSYV